MGEGVLGGSFLVVCVCACVCVGVCLVGGQDTCTGYLLLAITNERSASELFFGRSRPREGGRGRRGWVRG